MLGVFADEGLQMAVSEPATGPGGGELPGQVVTLTFQP